MHELIVFVKTSPKKAASETRAFRLPNLAETVNTNSRDLLFPSIVTQCGEGQYLFCLSWIFLLAFCRRLVMHAVSLLANYLLKEPRFQTKNKKLVQTRPSKSSQSVFCFVSSIRSQEIPRISQTFDQPIARLLPPLAVRLGACIP